VEAGRIAPARPLSLPSWLTPARVAIAVLGAATIAWTFWVRTRAFGAAYWIDEGLSVGIAQHGFFDIPGVLKQDGSPPLYYMLLNLWMEITGSGEEQTHGLSLLFATLCIPAGLWAGWSLAGARVGLIAALFCAGSPYLTAYAQETRMYSLVVLLSIFATATWLHAYVQRRRRYIPWFALSLAALLYTHLWSAFFVLGALAATAVLLWRADDRRAFLRDALLGFGGAVVLYLPWLPTALYHVQHTAAPWALGPTWRAAQQIPHTLVGGDREILITSIAVAAGMYTIWKARTRPDLPVLASVTVLLALMIGLSWGISQFSDVWVGRYFAIFFGPLILLEALLFSRAGVIGLVALACLAGFWFWPHDPSEAYKTNVRVVAADVSNVMQPGDWVLSTHPEQIPLLHHYLPTGMTWFDERGRVPDPQVMDWRDALENLRATRVSTHLRPILDRLPVGRRLLLVRPLVSRRYEWVAPWTSLVKDRSYQWLRVIERDPRLKRIDISNASPNVGRRNGAVQGRVYLKTKN
jgi:hypothetical protein